MWYAKYDVAASSQLPVDFRQPTRSRTVTGEASPHECFQTVLGWVWAKHAYLSQESGVSNAEGQPSSVEEALAPCADCANKLPCRWMARAEETESLKARCKKKKPPKRG